MFKSSALDSRVALFGDEHQVMKAFFLLAVFAATALKNEGGTFVPANKEGKSRHLDEKFSPRYRTLFYPVLPSCLIFLFFFPEAKPRQISISKEY